jgi:hypothetical protein
MTRGMASVLKLDESDRGRDRASGETAGPERNGRAQLSPPGERGSAPDHDGGYA